MKELYFQARVMMCVWAHRHTWVWPVVHLQSGKERVPYECKLPVSEMSIKVNDNDNEAKVLPESQVSSY